MSKVSEPSVVKAHWDMQLNFECPKCKDNIDYFNTVDYTSYDGWEGLPDALRGGKHKAQCDCGQEVVLDIQEGW